MLRCTRPRPIDQIVTEAFTAFSRQWQSVTKPPATNCRLCVTIIAAGGGSRSRSSAKQHRRRDVMPKRLFELVALGPVLRDEATRQGRGVNESYLLVHRVLAEAFREDLDCIAAGGLREHLSNRLKQRLQAQAA
jgi:hypothetical protein